MMTKKTRLGITMGLLCMFFISLSAIFGKILLNDFTPETLLAVARAMGLVLLFFFFGFLPEIVKIQKLKKKQLLWFILISIITGAISPALFFKGLDLTTATDTVLISRMEPVLASIISVVWLKEKMSWKQIVGGLLMFLGVCVIATGGFQNSITANIGYIYLIIAAIGWAFSTNIFKKYLSNVSPEVAVVFRNFIGAIILFAVIPYLLDFNHDIEPIFNKDVFFIMAIHVIFVVIIARLLFFKSVELLPVSTYSILSLSRPIFGVSLAVLFLNEQLYVFHIYGGGLILIGLGIISLYKHKYHKKFFSNKTKKQIHKLFYYNLSKHH